MKTNMPIRYLVQAAVVAALYAALTLLLAPLSYASVQLRVSEALTILPVLLPAAVPGLFVGCLLANMLGGCSALDILCGSLATLLAAVLTRRLKDHAVLAAVPPVLANALIVGLVLSLTVENLPFWMAALSVGAGQAVACFALGLPLLWALRKTALGGKL